ncbi:hypothetical protein BDV39DRAFT_170548 [Aspergillus sergii]|uniref:Uncharacterized protein n=1 Tax=Aspergillus sergii TaxID=1034303 RepID=A0A5N6XFQ5_9EURO|nr:hypothetical protein BDV39DRAFT_170548 [Aspergillus sergii]
MLRPSLALQAAISSHTDRLPGRSAAILDYAVFSSWRSKWARRSPRCWANREGWPDYSKLTRRRKSLAWNCVSMDGS